MPASAARSVTASLRRVGVLQVDDVDVAGGALRAVGWSSLLDQRAHQRSAAPGWRRARSASCCAARRCTVVRNEVSAWPWPGAAAAPPPPPASTSRCTSGARSEASAWRSGIDLDIGGVGHVQRRDDAAQALQVVGVVGDHQRVVAGVDVDRVVGADQRPQDRHQVVGGLVVQPEDLRDDLAAADRRAARPMTAPPCSLASASGTTLQQAADSTTVKPGRRSVARNWLKAAAGGTGRSVVRLIVPLTRGSTTMLRPVMAAMVRATASISALTKFSVTGSLARCASSGAGAPASSAQTR